jgi:hypothetical protein
MIRDGGMDGNRRLAVHDLVVMAERIEVRMRAFADKSGIFSPVWIGGY